MLENGQPLDWVMEELFAAMQGHVLLCHGATVEQRFINAYLQQTFGLRDLPLPWLDTLALERNRSAHKGAEHNDFRLSSVRARQGVATQHPAHDALTDAVAISPSCCCRWPRRCLPIPPRPSADCYASKAVSVLYLELALSWP